LLNTVLKLWKSNKDRIIRAIALKSLPSGRQARRQNGSSAQTCDRLGSHKKQNPSAKNAKGLIKVAGTGLFGLTAS